MVGLIGRHIWFALIGNWLDTTGRSEVSSSCLWFLNARMPQCILKIRRPIFEIEHQVHDELAVHSRELVGAELFLVLRECRRFPRLTGVGVHLLDILAQVPFHLDDGFRVADEER